MMKKFVLALCLCMFTVVVIGQVITVPLSHNITSERLVLQVKPIGYTDPKCDNFELSVSFTYNQLNETITAVIESAARDIYDFKYNYIWIPKEDYAIKNTRVFTKNFYSKYNQKISCTKQFKKQTRENHFDLLQPIICESCKLLSCNTASNAKRYTNFSLENEIFLLNDNKIVLKFNILGEASNPKIDFVGFVVVSRKMNSFGSNEKLLLNYIADDFIFHFKINRDPCVIDRNALDEVNFQNSKLKSYYAEMENAKKSNSDSKCKEIKESVRDGFKEQNLKGKYSKSKCEALINALKDYNSNYEKITGFKCDSDPCKQAQMLQLADSVQTNIPMLKLIYENANIARIQGKQAEIEKWKNRAQEINKRFNQSSAAINDLPPCESLNKLIQEQQSILDNIEAIDFIPPPPPTCILNTSKIRKAGDDIKNLTDKWMLGDHSTHAEFDNITSRMDKDIQGASVACKNNCKDAIKYYESFKQTYITITKRNK